MKSLKKLFGKTKRGATSIYIVVFATILFGVVTLSFVRIMLSEASQSSNDDLSQSAYDSAMAGVEDAKIAVNAYYKCLSEGGSCDSKNVITKHPDDPSCDQDFVLGEILHGMPDKSEVPIISTSASINGETDSSDQAYTCVIISDVTPDYRGTLTSDTRTKVIPISVPRDGVTTSYDSANLNEVFYIDFSWYSELNRGALQKGSYITNDKFADANHTTIPPTIQLTFIKVAQGHLNLNELRAADSDAGSVINSTMVLLPAYVASGSTASVTSIASNQILSYGQISSTDSPVLVTCGDDEFACTARLEVNGLNLREGDNVFLVASLPYGDSMSDFAVTLRRQDETAVKFHGVQISVDSTGRTNQLFRRVETRLDPADLFFPYPQYAIELGGDGGESLSKKFWITANCWYNQPDNGGPCANNGNV